jgi:alkylation response protein AidB-like acyl-CoA dehydrogenase
MDFSEPEHIQNLRDSLRRMLDVEAPPALLSQWDKAKEMPLDHLQSKLAELGVLGVTVPEEYGGLGRDVPAMVATIEELAKRSIVLAGLYIMVACYGGMNLSASASEAQKKRLLPELAAGKLRFAYGLSEPDVGADLGSVATRAERKGDKLIINGAKRWCSGGEVSDYIFMLVRSGPVEARHRNLSIVLVPRGSPGMTMSRIGVMGSHGIPTNDIYLDNVSVPFDLVLGEEAGWNNGWAQLTGHALEAEKLEVPALALGCAQAALDEAWQYSQERRQFGKRICAFQAVRHALADAKSKVEACRQMLRWATWLVDNNMPAAAATSMTKLFVTETASEVVLSCQKILGAYGYGEGFAMERYVRDVLALPIYGGSSAIQRNNISNLLGLPRE